MPQRIDIEQALVLSKIERGYSIIEIAKQLGIGRRTLYNKFERWGFTKRDKQFNHNFFHEINTEEKAYWLGFLMADGCVYINKDHGTYKLQIVLNIKDEGHLFKFHKALNSSIGLRYFSKSGRKYVCSDHCGKEICDSLIKHGCTQRKSLTLEFPTWLPKHLLNHFVRGYFDGDGSIFITKDKSPQLRFNVVGTKQFLTSLQNIFGTSNKLQRTGNAYELNIQGNIKAKAIFDWLYKNATIYLERKYSIYSAFNKARHP